MRAEDVVNFLYGRREAPPEEDTMVVPFELPELNSALGGGQLVGGVTLLYGGTASGKSYLSLLLLAQLQRVMPVALVDMPRHHPDFLRFLGVREDQLLRPDFESLEGALEALLLVREAGARAVLLDDASLCAPLGEVLPDGQSALPGARSRILGHALSKLSPSWRLTLVVTDQVRALGRGEVAATRNILAPKANQVLFLKRTGTSSKGITLSVTVMRSSLNPPGTPPRTIQIKLPHARNVRERI